MITHTGSCGFVWEGDGVINVIAGSFNQAKQWARSVGLKCGEYRYIGSASEISHLPDKENYVTYGSWSIRPESKQINEALTVKSWNLLPTYFGEEIERQNRGHSQRN